MGLDQRMQQRQQLGHRADPAAKDGGTFGDVQGHLRCGRHICDAAMIAPQGEVALIVGVARKTPLAA